MLALGIEAVSDHTCSSRTHVRDGARAQMKRSTPGWKDNRQTGVLGLLKSRFCLRTLPVFGKGNMRQVDIAAAFEIGTRSSE